MASYKYNRYIVQSSSDAFDGTHTPGVVTPFSGINRCLGCGREDVSTQGHPLPPQNHHQHTPHQGVIRWRLVAWAGHNPKEPPG